MKFIENRIGAFSAKEKIGQQVRSGTVPEVDCIVTEASIISGKVNVKFSDSSKLTMDGSSYTSSNPVENGQNKLVNRAKLGFSGDSDMGRGMGE